MWLSTTHISFREFLTQTPPTAQTGHLDLEIRRSKRFWRILRRVMKGDVPRGFFPCKGGGSLRWEVSRPSAFRVSFFLVGFLGLKIFRPRCRDSGVCVFFVCLCFSDRFNHRKTCMLQTFLQVVLGYIIICFVDLECPKNIWSKKYDVIIPSPNWSQPFGRKKIPPKASFNVTSAIRSRLVKRDLPKGRSSALRIMRSQN